MLKTNRQKPIKSDYDDIFKLLYKLVQLRVEIAIVYNYFIIKSCKSKWRTELTSEESNIQNLLLKDVEILKML